ncbi:HEAT repeat domain-containing protein [bacterium]|nr:MAG: HEAT repeat domain-containing protein [bacterium]
MSNDEVFQLLDEMAQGQHAIMLRTLQRWAERDAAATTGALVEALGDEEVRIRARAAWALSLLGDVQQRPEVVPALVYPDEAVHNMLELVNFDDLQPPRNPDLREAIKQHGLRIPCRDGIAEHLFEQPGSKRLCVAWRWCID